MVQASDFYEGGSDENLLVDNGKPIDLCSAQLIAFFPQIYLIGNLR